jgi:hypothetical protein
MMNAPLVIPATTQAVAYFHCSARMTTTRAHSILAIMATAIISNLIRARVLTMLTVMMAAPAQLTHARQACVFIQILFALTMGLFARKIFVKTVRVSADRLIATIISIAHLTAAILWATASIPPSAAPMVIPAL